MKLFSQNSNLYDHDTSTSQTDRRTDGQLALAIPGSARLRAVKTTTTIVYLRLYLFIWVHVITDFELDILNIFDIFFDNECFITSARRYCDPMCLLVGLFVNLFETHYLENGWRYRLGYNGTPIGNAPAVSNGHVLDDVT